MAIAGRSFLQSTTRPARPRQQWTKTYFLNTFEGGSDDTLITNTNTGGASGDEFNVGQPGPFFDDDIPMLTGHGSYVVTCQGNATQNDFEWIHGVTDSALTVFYFRYTALRQAGGPLRISCFIDTAVQVPGQIQFTDAGDLLVIDSASATVHTVAISPDTWYRIEHKIVQGPTDSTGTNEFRLYLADSPGAPLSTYSNVGGANCGTNKLFRTQFGSTDNNNDTQSVMHFDTIRLWVGGAIPATMNNPWNPTIYGSLATETDTANAGSASVNVSVQGQQATEADTGRVGAPVVVVVGNRATETDTANRGGIALGNGIPTVEFDNRHGLYLPGTGSPTANVSSPDIAAFDITNDLDIAVLEVTSADWTASASQTLISRWVDLGFNERSWIFRISTTGFPVLIWSTNGTATVTQTCSASMYSIGVRDGGPPVSLRVTLDVDNGASGYDVKFWYSFDTGLSPTWIQMGSTITGGATTSIYNPSGSALTIGGHNGGSAGFSQPFTGFVRGAQWRQGIGGSLIFEADFSDQTKWRAGQTSGTDTTTGKTISINSNAAIYQSAGTPVVVVAGNRATETDTATSGAVAVAVSGKQGKETDNPHGVYLPGDYVTSTANSYVTTPDHTDLRYTATDMEGEFTITVQDALTHGSVFQMIASKINTLALSGGGWYFGINTDGKPRLLWGTGAVTQQANATDSLTTWFQPGQRFRLKVTLDKDNGSGVYEVKFWIDGGGGYIQLGSTVTGAGVATIASYTGSMRFGADLFGNNDPHQLIVHRATLRDGIGGTTLFDADFESAALWPNGATSGTDTTGKTVTLGSAASIYQTHGSPIIATTGQRATETDTGRAGAAVVTYVGQKATETDSAFSGTAIVTVVGQRATETDTGNAGAVVVVVTGQQATETDTGNAGSISVSMQGTQAQETDTGRAGAAIVTVQGQRATETDSGAAGSAAVTVQGSLATETDTGRTGAPATSIPGTKATETDSAFSGAAIVVYAGSQAQETDTANVGTPAAVVFGSQAVEIDSAFAGSAVEEGGDVTYPGSQATETDSAFGGAVVVVVQGSQATETDTAFGGTAVVTVAGQSATETDSANSGAISETMLGAQATETDTANSGTAAATVVGQRATETDTGNAGTASVSVQGSRADETDTGVTGSASVSVQGQRATETDTGNTGSVSATVAGQQALETDTANPGTPAVVVQGQRAEELDEAFHGSADGSSTIVGNRATETDTANTGSAVVVVEGSKADETDAAFAGTVAATVQGQQAQETDTASAGVPIVVVHGAQAQETDTGNPGAVFQGQVAQGTRASETDTAASGSASVSSEGSRATETNTGHLGSISITWIGLPASETDTGNPGTSVTVYQGSSATETDTGRVGSSNLIYFGDSAIEVDSAFVGIINASYSGTRATEIDTGFGGAPVVIVPPDAGDVVGVLVTTQFQDRLMVHGAQERLISTMLTTDRLMALGHDDRSVVMANQERRMALVASDALAVEED